MLNIVIEINKIRSARNETNAITLFIAYFKFGQPFRRNCSYHKHECSNFTIR